MIRRIVIGVVLLFCLVKVVSSTPKTQIGLIVLENKDTIKCNIHVYDKNILLSNNKIKYRINDQKKKVNTSEVEKVIFDSVEYHIITIPSKKPVKKGPRTVYVDFEIVYLVKLVVNGKFQLYEKYYLQNTSLPGGTTHSGSTTSNGITTTVTTKTTSSVSMMETSRYILSEGRFVEIRMLGFKESCLQIFSDCENVKEKIEDKTYKFKNLAELLIYANENCN